MSEQIADVWLDGWQAYRDDVAYDDCPYPPGLRRVEWQSGWEGCDAPDEDAV